MNIYQKIQKMRVDLQGMNIKKSGKNKHMGYDYYELADIMPPINKLQDQYGTCSFVTFNETEAVLTIVNSEKPEEAIEFASPMKDAVLKGAHPIQNLGAVETYQRRYLYMAAFEIVEADTLDASQGSGNTQTGGGQYNSKGSQKGSQRTAQGPQSNRRQNTKLPDDLSDQLNTAIKMAKQVTGRGVQEIVAELEEKTGIKMADVTVETAPVILEAVDEIAGAVLPF